MSRENVEFVASMYDDFRPETFESKLALADPEIEWHTTGQFLDAGVHKGRTEVLRFLREFWGAFEVVEADVEELIDADDQVVAVARFVARGRESGAQAELRLGHVWTFEAGSPRKVQTFRGRTEALEAVGLSD